MWELVLKSNFICFTSYKVSCPFALFGSSKALEYCLQYGDAILESHAKFKIQEGDNLGINKE